VNHESAPASHYNYHFENSAIYLFPEVSGIGGTYDGALGMFDVNLNFTDMKIYGGSLIDVLKRIEIDDSGNFYFLGYIVLSD